MRRKVRENTIHAIIDLLTDNRYICCKIIKVSCVANASTFSGRKTARRVWENMHHLGFQLVQIMTLYIGALIVGGYLSKSDPMYSEYFDCCFVCR